MLTQTIPFNKVFLTGNESEYLQQALSSGKLCGNGPFSRRCSAFLEQTLGASRVFLVPSCTHALEMSGLLLDLQPGDEVLVPSFTFVSTANAYAMLGAVPVFVDIDPETLNLDPASMLSRLTPRTRAVVPVHYGGVACEMDRILALATEHGLTVIEDNAHGLFASYRERPLGSLGRMSTLSFHETKNVVCGEGGALVLNDPELVERAHILQEKGTDRSKFVMGMVDKYTWVDRGSSYLLGELPAAMLWAQLEAHQRIQARRVSIWETYRSQLSDWAARHQVRLQRCQPGSVPAGHLFSLVMPEAAAQSHFVEHLRAQGIGVATHYLPLHLSPMGRSFGGRPGDCPVSERVAANLVRLPLYAGLSDSEQARIIEAVQSFIP